MALLRRRLTFVRRPSYLPAGWKVFTHPEGKLYFWRSTGLPIVTEADLYDQDILGKVVSWATSIEDALRVKGIEPSTGIELFLDPQEDLEACEYYLVDHTTRGEFWVDQISSESLGAGKVASVTHLSEFLLYKLTGAILSIRSETALEVQYWEHVQYFPMHYPDCISAGLIDELLGVLCHGLAGEKWNLMTSFGTAFSTLFRRWHDFDDVNICIHSRRM